MLLSKTLVFSSLVATAVSSTCSYIQVDSGDGCWSLANRCGITEDELTTYNTATDFCNDLEANQYICCSEGTLPDFSPKPYSNGTCYTYTVQSGDTCEAIAKAELMDEDKISGYNNETWGWSGCSDLILGQRICLSNGTAPFPSALESALCGPQVPGTTEPTDMAASNWTNLNPCPLNACCDIWGQCGITPDFCTASSALTDAPGTAKNGTNGCISNCGTNITNNDEGPSTPRRIGYFEAWNADRPCLNMDVSKLQGNSYYTDIHWAFANLTESWEVDVSGNQDQFDGLLNLTGVNRVLSFGGWGFSTSAYTYDVLRTGVQEANRQTFADNVVAFMNKYELEGIDFDWEYPGATDIPGIPADSSDSGENYLEFLKLVRDQLPDTMTLSIAAPASYWYLRHFPIKEIAEVVDYIVFMTYDLHGQWDYNSTSSDPGCPDGGCLRSQVNKTETAYALSMITKAGVKSNKVIAGLPLYGRSFEMANTSCTGPECRFTGPNSGADEGICTQTAGYISNFELFEIIDAYENEGENSTYGSVTQYQDEGDVLIYNETNWVSWLSPSSYVARREWTDGLNFGGTSDWAIDLNQTYSNGGNGSELSSGDYDDDYLTPCDYSLTFDSLDAIYDAADDYRSDCVAVYTLEVLINMLNTSYVNYTNVNQGYDDLFSYYVTYMEDLVPEILKDDFFFNTSATGGVYATQPAMGSGAQYFECTVGSETAKSCSDINIDDELAIHTTAITLTDEDGFETAIADNGFISSWVELGDYTYVYEYSAQEYGEVKRDFKFTGSFPIQNASMTVPNPKDIVTQALPDIPTLMTEMQATLLDLMLSQWQNGSISDPASAYSMPVFMLMQAVENMAEVKKLGTTEKTEEAEEAKRKKDFILLIVSVVLMFVPIVGEEVAAAAGLATVARTVAVAGELANGALAVYQTVDDPSSAVSNIIGMLFGIGSIAKVSRDGKGIASIAKLRASMKDSEIESFGTIFTTNDDKLQSILKICSA
ncbi:glycoside hydrolase [Penicillium odoratum]|uniref:glycoside hydrolase n=1 Tax=Penicillium odoratum TaxID=1167516 RepID=UPI002546DAB1|nr:glycoside hydrolase [Penicillium odoratum]KAJ5765052.1 glycoside hydrolase [Penicillium odoratum]